MNTENPLILIVDGNQQNLQVLGTLLIEENYEVSIAENGKEAIREAEINPPDLILMDVMMPGMNGFEAVERLKEDEATKNIPVIFVTAMSEDADEAKGFRIGAAEYKDNETGNHIMRMSKVSRIIAEGIGLRDSECELILNASPMHDIGKIGIPDRVLLKPGKLDPNEWEIMKTHVSQGVEILEGHDSSLLKAAVEIACTHHEKWDGSGYPNGLKGENIPISGRISAIADVFDALTSVRPYKEAWPVEKAIELLKSEKGRHFQPELVDIFVSKLPEILEITKSFTD